MVHRPLEGRTRTVLAKSGPIPGRPGTTRSTGGSGDPQGATNAHVLRLKRCQMTENGAPSVTWPAMSPLGHRPGGPMGSSNSFHFTWDIGIGVRFRAESRAASRTRWVS